MTKQQQQRTAAQQQVLDEGLRNAVMHTHIPPSEQIVHFFISEKAISKRYFEAVKEWLHKGANVNAIDGDGKTVLHIAAMNGRSDLIPLLVQGRADVNAVTAHGWTALDLAYQCKQAEAINVLQEITLQSDQNTKNLGLFIAARNGDAAFATRLLKKGADIKGRLKDGGTVLHRAARKGHVELIPFLIGKGADINAVTNDGWTALHSAAWQGQGVAISTLIEMGADVVAETKNGNTALDLAYQYKQAEAINVLQEITLQSDQNTKNLGLFIAARHGDIAFATRLLEAGADIHARAEDGGTALHYAAKNGHVELIPFLIGKGADIKAVTNDGWTALHSAAWQGKSAAISLLIEMGANVMAETKNGSTTALDLAYQYKHAEAINVLQEVILHSDRNTKNMGLFIAARHGDIAFATRLLEAGADRAEDRGTALHYAAKNGHVELIPVLIGKGADVNVVIADGWAALHTAAWKGQSAAISTLIEMGADVLAETQDGNTALDLAYQYKQAEAINVLQEVILHSDQNTKNLGLLIAVKRQDAEFVERLLEAGADINEALKQDVDLLFFSMLAGGVRARILMSAGADYSQFRHSQRVDHWAPEEFTCYPVIWFNDALLDKNWTAVDDCIRNGKIIRPNIAGFASELRFHNISLADAWEMLVHVKALNVPVTKPLERVLATYVQALSPSVAASAAVPPVQVDVLQPLYPVLDGEQPVPADSEPSVLEILSESSSRLLVSKLCSDDKEKGAKEARELFNQGVFPKVQHFPIQAMSREHAQWIVNQLPVISMVEGEAGFKQLEACNVLRHALENRIKQLSPQSQASAAPVIPTAQLIDASTIPAKEVAPSHWQNVVAAAQPSQRPLPAWRSASAAQPSRWQGRDSDRDEKNKGRIAQLV